MPNLGSKALVVIAGYCVECCVCWVDVESCYSRVVQATPAEACSSSLPQMLCARLSPRVLCVTLLHASRALCGLCCACLDMTAPCFWGRNCVRTAVLPCPHIRCQRIGPASGPKKSPRRISSAGARFARLWAVTATLRPYLFGRPSWVLVLGGCARGCCTVLLGTALSPS